MIRDGKYYINNVEAGWVEVTQQQYEAITSNGPLRAFQRIKEQIQGNKMGRVFISSTIDDGTGGAEEFKKLWNDNKE
jgi:hypothetical protein